MLSIYRNKFQRLLKKDGREKLKTISLAKIRDLFMSKPEITFPLSPPLPLPPGVSKEKLLSFLQSVWVTDAPPLEVKNYCNQDFKRFVYTYGLAQDMEGKCLELGANPYFTTMLLKQFTKLELTLANYFGPSFPKGENSHEVKFNDFKTGESSSSDLKYNHFNIEEDPFPYDDASFDVVLFCEIIEHLLKDPFSVLKEIKRVLKPGGILILTTPNASRLENVAKIVSGANIYDSYSAFGPYGRHNREYTKDELSTMLDYLGFSMDTIFSADAHRNDANGYSSIAPLKPLLKNRQHDLGQYIFIKAVNSKPAGSKKLAFLFRSYPMEELE